MIKNQKDHKVIKNQIIILLSLCALVACAGTQSLDGDDDLPRSDCIYQPSIRGYTVLDESNLIVTTSGRHRYHMVLQRRAHGLRSSWGIAFKSPTGRICPAFSEVIFDGHFDGESIRIAAIREISPEEEDHLLIRYGKKKPEIEQTPVPQEIEGAEVEELDTAADDHSSRD
ncbi:MAG: hypothetical protein GY949_18695 [Gammaproteobacteria bacterium]|nr:hypothetical protein [Gammaproteobacteria bacterium]